MLSKNKTLHQILFSIIFTYAKNLVRPSNQQVCKNEKRVSKNKNSKNWTDNKEIPNLFGRVREPLNLLLRTRLRTFSIQRIIFSNTV